MKKILFMCVFLQACAYQTLDSGDILAAELACKEHKGVNSIKAWWTTSESVVCNDGFRIEYLKLPK